MDKQYIVAIEIGSSKIVGAIGERDSNGAICVTSVDSEKVIDCVRFGRIQNVEETKLHVNHIIKRLETRINPRKITGVYVGVHGRSLHSIVSEVSLKLNEENIISENTIERLKKKCYETAATEDEMLDIVPRQYFVDNVERANPIGDYGTCITAKFNVIVAKKSLTMNIKRVFDSQYDIKGFLITPLAVADEILTSDERQLGCMLIDFGAETTTVSIYKNNALQYLSTLPLGSRLITRDITSLSVLESRAEEIKKTIGNANGIDSEKDLIVDGLKSSDVSNYVVARSGEIVANINEQIIYASMTSGDLSAGAVVIGCGSRLNGFNNLIEQTLNLKTTQGHHAPRINILEPNGNSLEYVQAVALIAKAGEIMPVDESCVIVPVAEPVVPPKTDVTGTKEQGRERENTPKKPGRFSKFFDNLKNKAAVILEDSEDKEDEFE